MGLCVKLSRGILVNRTALTVVDGCIPFDNLSLDQLITQSFKYQFYQHEHSQGICRRTFDSARLSRCESADFEMPSRFAICSRLTVESAS